MQTVEQGVRDNTEDALACNVNQDRYAEVQQRIVK